MSIKKATALRIVLSVCLVVAVGLSGLLVTFRVADGHRRNYNEQRKVQASTAAAAIDARDVASLKGGQEDIRSPAFARIRSQLVRIKRSDPHVRFVYLMRPQDKKMVFLVDAEDPSSPDYSPPGQVYEEAKPSDFDVFNGKKRPDAIVEDPIRDRWGVWSSASAYILDNDGKPVALLGTDVDVERALSSFNEIRQLGIVFVLVAVLLLMLVLLQWIVWRYHKDRQEALRLEVEKSARKLSEELLKADQMKSEFIQVASHELRGPVNAINIAVQTMDHEYKSQLPKDGQTLVEVAKNGANRLVDLVDNLLDLTRIEAGDYVAKPSPSDLCDLVMRTVRLFEPLAGNKGLRLVSDLPESGSMDASVDAQAVLRVLENLVSNAIKFTEDGEITVAVEATEEKAHFSVEDTGRGIPTDAWDDLFKKFSMLGLPGEPIQRGAGIGLAVCKGLVEAQGGRIWVESEEGLGTTFHFEIPRYQEEQGKGGLDGQDRA